MVTHEGQEMVVIQQTTAKEKERVLVGELHARDFVCCNTRMHRLERLLVAYTRITRVRRDDLVKEICSGGGVLGRRRRRQRRFKNWRLRIGQECDDEIIRPALSRLRVL